MEKLSRQFVEYLSEVIGQPVSLGSPVSGRLPQYLAQRYGLQEIETGQHRFLGIFVKEGADLRPAQFEKHLAKMMPVMDDLEGYCLIAKDLPSYVRQRLVKRRIPFVVPGRQLYWPDMGVAVQARKAKGPPGSVEMISPATQALLIFALTGGMPRPITPKILAKKLGYTATTLSRALDEIEANHLGQVVREGRERLLSFPDGRHALWQAALPYMRDPVRKTVRIREKGLPLPMRIEAGETALAEISRLVFPTESVYALGRQDWRRIVDKIEHIPIEDEDTCQVQLWRYDPKLFADGKRVDCFSLYLSLRNEPDERVQAALKEIMEMVAWS